MNTISHQNKKNLRQRMNTLHLAVNKRINYGINLVHRGSLARGSGPLLAGRSGTYDLDVDFVIKTNDRADIVRDEIKNAIKINIRQHEILIDKERVICILVNENGYTYNFDIAIKNDKGQIALKTEKGVIWS